jgi:hypothetical protein
LLPLESPMLRNALRTRSHRDPTISARVHGGSVRSVSRGRSPGHATDLRTVGPSVSDQRAGRPLVPIGDIASLCQCWFAEALGYSACRAGHRGAVTPIADKSTQRRRRRGWYAVRTSTRRRTSTSQHRSRVTDREVPRRSAPSLNGAIRGPLAHQHDSGLPARSGLTGWR